MAESPLGQSKVFISYSHRDKDYLDRLQEHLKPHVRAGTIPLWVDTHLKPGDDWKEEIERALESAQVAILLVSVSFLASDFVAEEELPRLLAAAEGRGARILPVILTPCSFRRTKLSRFQAVNDPIKPLSGLNQHEQDVIWEQVVDAVLEALEKPLPAEQKAAPPAPAPIPPRQEPAPQHPAPAATQPPPAHSVPTPLRQEPAPQRAAPVRPVVQPATKPARPPLGTLLATCQGDFSSALRIAWSPDSKRLASAGSGAAVVWETASGKQLLICQGPRGKKYGTIFRVNDVAWSPDGTRIASASDDGAVRLWDAASGALLRTHEGPPREVYSVAWSPDGKEIASHDYHYGVEVWEATTGNHIATFRVWSAFHGGTGGSVSSIAWSPDGSHLAADSYDDVCQLNVSGISSERPRTLQGHTGFVQQVAWSPVGRHVASCSKTIYDDKQPDNTVRIWEAASGKQLLICQGHTDGVYGVAWAPNGSRLASASKDGTVRLWEAASGQCVFIYQGHTTAVRSVAWSPDGSRLASSGDDIQIWSAG